MHLPLLAKDPLIMKIKEEIGRVGGGGQGKTNNHDPLFPLSHPSPLFYFYFISFDSLFSSCPIQLLHCTVLHGLLTIVDS
jgi:hypothetical protein